MTLMIADLTRVVDEIENETGLKFLLFGDFLDEDGDERPLKEQVLADSDHLLLPKAAFDIATAVFKKFQLIKWRSKYVFFKLPHPVALMIAHRSDTLYMCAAQIESHCSFRVCHVAEYPATILCSRYLKSLFCACFSTW